MAVCEVTSIQELRDLYPIIEEGVCSINDRQLSSNPRIAPDVYHRIVSGIIKLMVIYDDDTVWGWGTYYSNDGVGVCEDMYVIPGAPRHIFHELTDSIEKSLLTEGVTELMCTTSRMALKRKLESHGFRLKGYIFGKEV